MLQADSEKLRQAWIKAVQTSIATAYREKGDESEVSLTIHQATTSPLDPENFKDVKPLLMRGKEKNNPLFVLQWKCSGILKAVNYI